MTRDVLDQTTNLIAQLVPPQYRLSEDMYRRLLARALDKGGDFAEIFLEYRPSTRLSLEEGQIRSLTEGVEAGVGIRVLKGDQVGYAFTEALDDGSLLDAAQVAAAIAHGSRAVPPQNLTRASVRHAFLVSDPPLLHPLREKLDLLHRANDAARSYDEKITEVQVMYQDYARYIEIANSDGLLVDDLQHIGRLIVFAIASDGTQQCSAYEAGGGRNNFGDFATFFQPELIAREAARTAVAQLAADDAPSGEMPVVIAAGYGGTMVHEAVGHGFEGDFIFRKTSVYAGKVGEKVAADGVTIIDDGTLPHLRGSYTIDDEGTPGSHNVLVENGILTGYMHDRISAQQLGMRRTGNGRRESFRYPPMPRMTNTYIGQGEYDPDEILRSVKRGVYAYKMGSGQVDITSGNFVFTVDEAALIEDGKITRPLRGATLIGNGPDSMRKITMIGNDLKVISAGTCGKGQWVPVGDGMPTVLVSSMTVGGK